MAISPMQAQGKLRIVVPCLQAADTCATQSQDTVLFFKGKVFPLVHMWAKQVLRIQQSSVG